MSLAIAPIVAFYDYALRPISALSWAGAPISILDIAGALRLGLILRQQREVFYREHLSRMSLSTTSARSARVIDGRSEEGPFPVVPVERRSRIRDFAASLIMVFGGEAIAGVSRILLLLCEFFRPYTLPGFYSPVARRAAHFLGLGRCSSVVSERQCAGRHSARRPRAISVY